MDLKKLATQQKWVFFNISMILNKTCDHYGCFLCVTVKGRKNHFLLQ